MALTRRQFLRKSSITAVGLSFSSPLWEQAAFADARGRTVPRAGGSLARSGERAIVAVNLFGGNDGLNTVVPLFQYDRYKQLRPKIGLDRERVLALPDTPDLGLNPTMTGIRDLYAAGKVAILPGVGAPHDAYGLFDHEASQYLFQTGDVKGSATATLPSGWIGRWLDAVNEGAISAGVNFRGGELLLRGTQREALTIESIESFQIRPGFDAEARAAAYADIAGIAASAGGVAERNRQLRLQVLSQSQLVRERTAGYEPAAAYPTDNALGDSLRECAMLLGAGLGVRALSVGYDGFDTHARQNEGASNDEPGYHDYLVKAVSDAIAAFHADLAGHGISENVLVVVFSEFGRRPEENNDRGTDHGLGSVALVVGDAVKGGVYGDHPSLEEEHLVLDGNVDATTDYRSVYATVLARHLDADPELVLGRSFPLLSFL